MAKNEALNEALGDIIWSLELLARYWQSEQKSMNAEYCVGQIGKRLDHARGLLKG